MRQLGAGALSSDTLVVRGLSDPRNKTVSVAIRRYDCKVVCRSVDVVSPGRRAWVCGVAGLAIVGWVPST